MKTQSEGNFLDASTLFICIFVLIKLQTPHIFYILFRLVPLQVLLVVVNIWLSALPVIITVYRSEYTTPYFGALNDEWCLRYVVSIVYKGFLSPFAL